MKADDSLFAVWVDLPFPMPCCHSLKEINLLSVVWEVSFYRLSMLIQTKPHTIFPPDMKMGIFPPNLKIYYMPLSATSFFKNEKKITMKSIQYINLFVYNVFMWMDIP